MWINGQDYSLPFYLAQAVISTVLWMILVFVILLVTFTSKPITQNARRWKASVLVGGLPVLVGLAIFLPAILVIAILTKTDPSNLASQELVILASGLFVMMSWLEYPVLFVAILAALGTYWKLRSSMDYWTDKILPPHKEETPSIHTWL